MLIDVLLETFDITQFLETRGFTLKRIGKKTGYLTDCPFCLKDEHLGVNPDRKTFGCYKCRTGGSIFKLIQKVLNKNFIETIEFLKSGLDDRHLNVNFIDILVKDLKTSSSVEENIKPAKLPKEYIPLTGPIEYTNKRKISLEQIRYYKIGVCYEGRYKNRLIVCDVDEKQVPIYWVARDITGLVDKRDKLWNPSSEYTNLGSSDILFNFSLAKSYSSVILTEGVFDSLYVGNNGVASYGKGLKASHLYWLIKGGFQDVILLYDADVANAELEESGLLLSQYFNVRICKLPQGDPDEFDKQTLSKYIQECGKFIPSRLNNLVGDLK